MRKVARLAVATAVGALALSGCNAIGDAVNDQVNNALEEGVEQILENTNEELGDLQIGPNASLPDGFPTGLPLPEGTLIMGVEIDGSFALSYELQEEAEAQRLADAIEAAGYELQESGESIAGSVWIFRGSEWGITLGVIADGDDYVMLQYSVIPESELA